MKYILFVAIILILGGGFYIYQTTVVTPKLVEEVVIGDDASYTTYTDTSAGVMFEYKTAPDGYVVDDMSEFIGEEDTTVLKVLRVINEREKIELETSEGGREGPPSISIMVFQNDTKLTASQWVDAMPRYSNIEFSIGAVDRDYVVGGANAVRYQSDGLYQNDNVVVAHNTYMYYFSGSFLEVDSVIYNDFKHLIESVTFVPTSTMPTDGSSAKINPQVACENALIYMTFESGSAAETFVAECVDGQHPEVIERYIKDMGLDGAKI